MVVPRVTAVPTVGFVIQDVACDPVVRGRELHHLLRQSIGILVSHSRHTRGIVPEAELNEDLGAWAQQSPEGRHPVVQHVNALDAVRVVLAVEIDQAVRDIRDDEPRAQDELVNQLGVRGDEPQRVVPTGRRAEGVPQLDGAPAGIPQPIHAPFIGP